MALAGPGPGVQIDTLIHPAHEAQPLSAPAFDVAPFTDELLATAPASEHPGGQDDRWIVLRRVAREPGLRAAISPVERAC